MARSSGCRGQVIISGAFPSGAWRGRIDGLFMRHCVCSVAAAAGAGWRGRGKAPRDEGGMGVGWVGLLR